MLLAVKNNVSKIIKKLVLHTSTRYILNYLQFTKVGKIKGMDVISAFDTI